jgi:hypothetical protein
MLFRETVDVYCENRTEHTDILCGQNAVYISSVRTSQETRYISASNPNRLMLFGESVAVYCENHTEHTNTLCRQNADFINFLSWLFNDAVSIEALQHRMIRQLINAQQMVK